MHTRNRKAPAATEAFQQKPLRQQRTTFSEPGPYLEPIAPLIPECPRSTIDWRLPRRQVA